MKTRIMVAVIALAALTAQSETSLYFIAGLWITPPYSGPVTVLRDGATGAPMTQLISVIKQGAPSIATHLPTTNVAVNHADASFGESSSPLNDGYVGSTNGLVAEPEPTGGEYYHRITGDTEDGAYARIYSFSSATGAAYYVNFGPSIAHDPPFTEPDPGTICSNINPCYSMMCFDVHPVKFQDGSANVISGSVNTVPGGNNNQLDNNLVIVYWRSNSGSAWAPLQNFFITNNGDFTGTYAGGTEVFVGMADSPETLPSSLLGQGPVVPTPEPGCAAVALAVIVALVRTGSLRRS